MKLTRVIDLVQPKKGSLPWPYAFFPILISAAILFFNGSLGPLGQALNHLLGIILLTIFNFCILSKVFSKEAYYTKSTILAILFSVCGWLGLIFVPSKEVWIFGVVCMLSGIALLFHKSQEFNYYKNLCQACLIFACWIFLIQFHPLFWKLENTFAVFISASMGATSSGLHISLLHSLLLFFLNQHNLRKKILFFFIPWLINGLFIIWNNVELTFKLGETNLGLAHGWDYLLIRVFADWVVIFVVLKCFTSFSTKKEFQAHQILGKINAFATIAISVILFCFVLFFEPSLQEIPKSSRFFVFKNPKTFHLDNSYKELFNKIEEWGYQIHITNEISALTEAPKLGDIIFIAFPIEESITAETKQILSAVKNGCGLFVAADHTNAYYCHDLLQTLLAELDYSLNFDSVFPLTHRWNDCLDLHTSSLKNAWGTLIESKYLVGASINPPWYGSIVAVGKYAYGDQGNKNGIPGNFIGDRIYGKGDTLGDLVLVASSYYGNGKVTVAGDPNFLLNSSLPWSENLLYSLFRDLSRLHQFPKLYEAIRIIFGLLFLLSTIILSINAKFIPWYSMIWVFLLSFSFYLSAFSHKPPSPNVSNNVWIDLSHHEEISKEGQASKSLEGLVQVLQLFNKNPHILSKLELKEDAQQETVLLIAPKEKFTQKETKNILNAVKRGNTLILSLGWEHQAYVKTFLHEAGVEILPVLQGKAFEPDKDFFANQALVTFREAYALKLLEEASTKILYTKDYPIVSETLYGQGRIVVIADPLFFLGGNLGAGSKSFGGNQQFIKKILRES